MAEPLQTEPIGAPLDQSAAYTPPQEHWDTPGYGQQQPQQAPEPQPSRGDPRGMIPVIREAAARYGHNPDTAVKVFGHEGLGEYVGDEGTSFGASQLHIGGGLGDQFINETGLDPRDPANEPAMIDWSMRNLGQTGWEPYHGAARAGVEAREGVGTEANAPASPPHVVAQPTKGPVAQGPFKSMEAAYAAAPANKAAYSLKETSEGYSWVPKTSLLDPGFGPSPLAPPQEVIQREADRSTLAQHDIIAPSISNAVTNIGRGVNGSIAKTLSLGAGILDTPGWLADKGLDALRAGHPGLVPDKLRFGTPLSDLTTGGEKLANQMGIDTEPKGHDWLSSLGWYAGQGVGAVVPIVGGAATALRLGYSAGNTALRTMSGVGSISNVAKTAISPGPLANEMALGASGGAGAGEAHEQYKSITGREGDLGDTLTQMIGGGIFNAARIPLVIAAEKGLAGAWQGAKAVVGKGDAGPVATLDATTGRAVADDYLRNDLQSKLNIAEQHVNALGTAEPADSAAYLAQRGVAAKAATQAWAKGSSAEEKELWSPASGVDLSLPRDYTKTQGLYQQLKEDHELSPLRDPESFPSFLGKLTKGEVQIPPTRMYEGSNIPRPTQSVEPSSVRGQGLLPMDTLEAGQNLRSRIGREIDNEMAVQGRTPDRALIGYMRQVRNQLTEDMATGGEGEAPEAMDAYRKAMAFSAGRAKLMDSDEISDVLTGRTTDSLALEKMIKQGPEGVDALRTISGVAQAKYGAGGLMDATKDAIRQKYTNAVAPYGYVSQADHTKFMTQYGGMLSDPAMADVRNQLEQVGAAGRVANVEGLSQSPSGGFGKSESAAATREARANLYSGAPTSTVLTHLQGVSDKFSATNRVLEQLQGDPTGQALLGFKHAFAQDALTGMGASKGPAFLAQNKGIIDAIERTDPGFRDAVERLSGRTPQGIALQLQNFIGAYLGSAVGQKIAGSGFGHQLQVASRSASIGAELSSMGLQKLTGLSSAVIADPEVREAWMRYDTGNWVSRAQAMMDGMLLHAWVPGLALQNLPTGTPGAPGIGNSPLPFSGAQGPNDVPWYERIAPVGQGSYDTKLSPTQEQAFTAWKQHYAPNDSGMDYDLRGAFKAGLTPDPQTGHWPDTFKKPNHPTFSNESQYSTPENPGGHWQGEQFIPAGKPP